jgi:hypothetical protein
MALKLASSLAYLCYSLVIGGGLVALAADRMSMPAVRDGALLGVLLGMASFGLDMIVRRRAEISTRYANETDPDFHVFRGWAAISWGIAFGLFGIVLVGFALVRLMEWTPVEDYFRARPGILIIVGGLIVAAFGAGSAGRATYRHKDVERPVARRGDRLLGLIWLAVGMCVISLGLLRMFAPAWLDAAEASALDRAISLVPK